MNKFLCYFLKVTAYLPWRVCFATKIHYKNKNSQGRRIKGSAIVISNHTSVYDFALMMFLFPFRTLRCLMSEIMFKKNWLLSWFLKGLGGIKVERELFDFRFAKEAETVLENGGVVEIYPESRLPLENEKRPLPFRPSAAYIGILTGVPIIPVYTDGNYFCFRRNHVIIGEKIYPSEIIDESLSEKENIEKLTNYLQNVVMELGNELEKEIKNK